MNTRPEVIIVGLGAMGSAAAYQLAKRGVKVLGLDQFSPPHTHGSTHGDSRLTRQAIGEGEVYTPLALRSYEIWNEIEKQSGQQLLTVTGGLLIADAQRPSSAHGRADFLDQTRRSAHRYAIEHENLAAPQIHARYPQFQLQGSETGYFEPKAGFLRPERCVAAQLNLARGLGAEIRTHEKVLSFSQQKGGVRLETDQGRYQTQKLILCAGPWLSDLVEKRHQSLFKVFRQVLFWFDVQDAYESFVPERFPVFIWDFGGEEGGIYGFPAIDGRKGGLKLAREDFAVTTDPQRVQKTVDAREADTMFEQFVAPRLAGVSRQCLKAVVCLYTVTPDFGFVIDRHPRCEDVLIASPCSGHGFKHSAAIGEGLAQMATHAKTTLDFAAFALNRFG